MQPFPTPRKAAAKCPWFLVLLIALGASLGACTTTETEEPPTEPGGKTTCEEVVASVLVGDLVLADRTLIPYSSTMLGVEAEYEGSDGVLTIVSGGFLDDQVEAYDTLLPIDEIPALGGHTAELFSGEFFGEPVLLASWKDPTLDPLCQLRAVVAVGLDLAEFRSILAGLSTRIPQRAAG